MGFKRGFKRGFESGFKGNLFLKNTKSLIIQFLIKNHILEHFSGQQSHFGTLCEFWTIFRARPVPRGPGAKFGRESTKNLK